MCRPVCLAPALMPKPCTEHGLVPVLGHPLTAPAAQRAAQALAGVQGQGAHAGDTARAGWAHGEGMWRGSCSHSSGRLPAPAAVGLAHGGWGYFEIPPMQVFFAPFLPATRKGCHTRGPFLPPGIPMFPPRRPRQVAGAGHCTHNDGTRRLRGPYLLCTEQEWGQRGLWGPQAMLGTCRSNAAQGHTGCPVSASNCSLPEVSKELGQSQQRGRGL